MISKVGQQRRASMIWRTPRHREQSLESSSFVSSVTTARESDPDWIGPQDGTDRNTRQHSLKRQRDRQGTTPGANDDVQWKSIAKRQNISTPPPNLNKSAPSSTALRQAQKESLLPRRLTPPPETHKDSEELPFCLPSCISSLVNRTNPDPSCPNCSFHQQCQRRPSSVSELLSLARSSITLPGYRRAFEQCEIDEEPPISRTPTPNALYTGQFGAVSAIFKVRIQPGGYVLLAKAARHYEPSMKMDTVYHLQREEKVYKRLRVLQGKTIPVCVGLVDLSDTVEDQGDDRYGRLPAFLLLSWAGSSLLSRYGPVKTHDIQHTWTQLAQARLHIETHLNQIHDKGVLHGDAELRNFVVDGTAVFLVDFERASSKGQMKRRAKGVGRYTAAEWDDIFQRDCEYEKGCCLEQFDTWAERLLR